MQAQTFPPSCKATTVRGVRDSNSTQGR
jgi:hypothetical protein